MWAGCGFLILTLLMTYPLSLRLTTSLPDKQDPLLNVWILTWEAHQLVRAPWQVFNANIFYPFRNTLAYSETLFSTSGLGFPFMVAPSTRILGFNLMFLATFVLSAFGTYLLVFALTRQRLAGVVAGLIFAFAPYRFGHLSQIQLLSAQWFPFVILSLDRLLRRPARQPSHRASVRSVLPFVVFFVAQCLASFYYAFQVALVVGLYVLFFLVAHRHSLNRVALGNLVLAAALSTALVLPLSLPYLAVQNELDAGWSLESNETFSASLQAYVYTAESNPLYGSRVSDLAYTYGPCCPPDTLFPGLMAIFLALAGLVGGRKAGQVQRASLRKGFFALLLLVAFVLSLGPTLHVRAGQAIALPFSLPYAWLYRAVPIFRAMRAPVRFANLVMLALAVLAGWGAAYLLGRLPSRTRALVTAGLAGAILLEFAALPVGAIAIPTPDTIPPVYRWLADQPPAVILELPVASKLPTSSLSAPTDPRQAWATSRLLEHQYFSTFHWHTTPDGYSGFIPSRHGEMVYEMERFPSARAIAALQALDVRWLILHSDDFSAERWAAIQSGLPRFPEVGLVETFESDYVYRVQATQRAAPLAVAGYLPPTAQAGQTYVAHVLLRAPDTGPVAAKPTDRVPVRATWTDSHGQGLEVRASFTLPLVNSGAEVRAIELTTPAEAGAYRLVMESVGEGDVPAFQAEGQVTVGEQAGDGAMPVPVQLLPLADAPTLAARGDTLRVDLRWQILGKINEYDSAFVRLVDDEGRAIAQADHGAGGPEHPTLLWVPGETVADAYTLNIPADAAPGLYLLEAGLYRPDDLAPRLLLGEGREFARVVRLASITIQ